MAKISKISKLDNTEGFLQVDYFKGNKYIDKAGEFLNSLYESQEDAPKYSMSPNGAEIIFGKGEKRVEVNTNRLWTGYVGPDSLEMQKQFFTKVFDSAVKLFEPASFNRVGWRNHFVTEEGVDNTKFFNNSDWLGGEFRELFLAKDFGGLKSNIRISKVQNSTTQKMGILIDVDLYKTFKRQSNSSVVSQEIVNIADTLRSDEMLEFINQILQDVPK